mgnify:CR=1 FL=1
MDFLSLVSSGSFASTDSPNRLVSEDDFLEVVGRKVEQGVLYLLFHNVEVCAVLSFFEHLADAEDRSKAFQSQATFL